MSTSVSHHYWQALVIFFILTCTYCKAFILSDVRGFVHVVVLKNAPVRQGSRTTDLHSAGFVLLCKSHQLEHLTAIFGECK